MQRMQNLTPEEQEYEQKLLDWIKLWTDRDSTGQKICYCPIPSWVSEKRFWKIRDNYIQYHNVSYASRGGKFRHRWELADRVLIRPIGIWNQAKYQTDLYQGLINNGNNAFKLLFQGNKKLFKKIALAVAEIVEKEIGL